MSDLKSVDSISVLSDPDNGSGSNMENGSSAQIDSMKAVNCTFEFSLDGKTKIAIEFEFNPSEDTVHDVAKEVWRILPPPPLS